MKSPSSAGNSRSSSARKQSTFNKIMCMASSSLQSAKGLEEENEEDDVVSHFDEHSDFVDSDEAHISHQDTDSSKESQEKMRLMRSKTLAKYSETLKSDRLGFQKQYEKREMLHREDVQELSNPDFRKTRMKRAQTLKKDFFQDILKDEIEEDSQGDHLLHDETFVSYAELEQSLKDNFVVLSENEKMDIVHHREAIGTMAKALLNDQDTRMNAAKLEAKRITPQIRKHTKALSTQLKKKERENFEGSSLATNEKPKKRLFFQRKPISKRNLTEDGLSKQAKYEQEIMSLKKEISIMSHRLSQIRLESRFPRALQWKLKVDAGDSTFIGIKDLEIGKIRADYHLVTGDRKKTLTLQVRNIEATVGILELSIRGGAKAKILGSLLTPTINRLDLDITGSWTLELTYSSSSQWKETGSNFKLSLSRKVTGISVVRLPSSIWQSLSNILIPKIISGALRSLLPIQIGAFLAESYNNVSIAGMVDITGDLSPKVWREPLVIEQSSYAKQARDALQISEEEAVILDYICRGERARGAGFKNKAVSLARLFKWRLKFGTYQVEELKPMLDMVQQDSRLDLPKGWLVQIFKAVSNLSKKPIDIKVKVERIQVECDLNQAINTGLDIYISEKKKVFNMQRADKARAAAERHLEQARTNAVLVNRVMDYIAEAISSQVRVVANGMLVGGQDGLVAAKLYQISAEARLPDKFNISTVLPSNRQNHAVQIVGKAGPRPDEYSFQVSRKNQKEQAESSVSLRNTQLTLFPIEMPQGTVKLTATEVRGGLQLNLLDFLLVDTINKNEVKKKEKAEMFPLRKDTKKLLQASEKVIGMFRTYKNDDHEEGKVSGEDTAFKVLPSILTSDAYDLRCDISGLDFVVEKVDGHGLKLEVTPHADLASNISHKGCAYFHIRMNMRDMFDELL